VTKFLLIGFYGRGNFGDDLMLHALVAWIRSSVASSVSVFCDRPQVLEGVGAGHVKRGIFSLIVAVARCDVLVQGGGTIFHDSYEGRHLRRYWVNLFLYGCIFLIARLFGKPVVLLGSGIGPIRHEMSRRICRFALRRVAFFQVRDVASVRELEALGVQTRNIAAAHDLSVLAESQTRSAMLDPTRTIGISLCDLTPFERPGAVYSWSALSDALNTLSEQCEFRVVLLSCFTGSSSVSDGDISRDFVSRLNGKIPVCHVEYSNSPDAFKVEIGRCEYLVATRFHACVAGYLVGVPVVAVAYNRKVTDFCDAVGLDANQVVSLSESQCSERWLGALAFLLRSAKPEPATSLRAMRAETAAAVSRAIATAMEER
jgi:polysaccharide pyruvyl transferase CsaB